MATRMPNKLFRILIALVCIIAITMNSNVFSFVSAADQQLENGAVSGLDEGIFIQDSQGNAVSKDGKYYIDIKGMKPNVIYKKEIVLQNLIRDNYTISMNAEPISSTGNLDLLNNTTCKLYLDDKLVYEGKVTGDGEPDMSEQPLDFGTLKSGTSKKLTAEIVWGGKGFEKVKGNEYSAKVEFLWIFNAIKTPNAYSENPQNSDFLNLNGNVPNTGLEISYVIIGFGIILFLCAIFVAVKYRDIKQEEGESDD